MRLRGVVGAGHRARNTHGSPDVSDRVQTPATRQTRGSAGPSAQQYQGHEMVLSSGNNSRSFRSLALPNWVSSFQNSSYWPVGDVETVGLAVGSGLAVCSGLAVGSGLELGELAGDGAGVAVAEGAGVAC
jgi:hypothetical protein